MKHTLLTFLFLIVGITQIEAQTTLDCANGPLDVSYCYGNNDNTVVTYTSSDGSPLKLTIDSGAVEFSYDQLIILDTDGVTDLNQATPYGANGNISGLSYISSGDSISFAVDSDGSVSCFNGNGCCAAGINYSVVCLTCSNPDANFIVEEDCANGNQFFINVDVTSLGDASSITIFNSFDATTINATAIGIYQIGPFPFLNEITVSVQNDQDINCSINSAPIELSTCPPENDEACSATVLVEDTADDTCNLIASGTIFGATGSNVQTPNCQGDVDDDVWFQFTAITESQLVNIQNVTAGTFNLDHAVYSGTCDNLVELYCSTNPTSVASQLNIGSTYFIRVFSEGSDEETSSFDVCLRDAPSNVVCEEAIAFCTSNGTLTTPNTVGLPGTDDIACLFSTPNQTWNIIQIGESGPIEIEIVQTSSSGNGLDVDFVAWGPFASLDNACSVLDLGCPTANQCVNNTNNPNFYPYGNIVDCSYSANSVENLTIENALSGEIYIILVTNFSNDIGTISISQTNLSEVGAGSITGDVEVDLGPDLNICDSDTNLVTLEAESPFADTYEWYYNGVFVSSESAYDATESGTYSVILYNNSCDSVAEDDIQVTFIDCNEVGLINVRAFYDTNQNGVFDTGEQSFNNGYFTYELNDDAVINTVSSSTGSFTLASSEDTDTYDINYYFYDDYEDCYDVTTAVFEDVGIIIGENVDIEFPIVDQQSCEDIAVYIISDQSPQPGFVHNNYLVIENLGLITTSGSLDFTVDSNLTVNSISTNANYTTTLNANGFSLDFVNIPPGETLTALISFTASIDLNLGDLVTNTAEYITITNDLVAENNISSLTQEVIGSFDPNDKLESHGRAVQYDNFINSDEYLYYTIRFQNIGTAAASFVRIEDVLDVQLDETTFVMLRSSHDYVSTRTNSSVEWFFEDINLPAEQDDAEGSIGYVYFKVKPKPGYAIGDIIPNNAAIFFDFNAPIITNTFQTEFVEDNLSVEAFETSSFEIYPNPVSDILNVKLNNVLPNSVVINIYDIQGKLIHNIYNLQNKETIIDVSQFQSGLYFVELITPHQQSIKKLVIE
ncbi:T9SS type A sorting domain-containing protein [uncultured Psychroserpens sp.]|uniref:T9SS type A sorting domain-containing protein n=1 Tax=uncultured Psychroserpens sp. TaxID=255436 RepID=UPI00260E62A0|nr:T9SS type A sorting domain-containing protein [uncultured Psychroserpens sp.]